MAESSSEKTKGAKGMADENVEKLRSEVSQLREDLRNVADSVKDLASHRGEEYYARLRQGADSARQQAMEAEQAIERHIQERPLTSVLTVFIGGLIAGLLLRSRR